jgi:hypothetical protein
MWLIPQPKYSPSMVLVPQQIVILGARAYSCTIQSQDQYRCYMSIKSSVHPFACFFVDETSPASDETYLNPSGGSILVHLEDRSR